MHPELVERLLSANPSTLPPAEAALRVLIVLDQSVHGFASYEDFYRAGYTADDAVAALHTVKAERAAVVLEPLLRSHDWRPDREPDLEVLRRGLEVYDAVAADIGTAIEAAVASFAGTHKARTRNP